MADGGPVIKPVFKPEFFRELAAENPLGITLHWREAEAWFNYIAWPAYKTYKYTRHGVAVRRWWANLSMKDIDRAREAVENARLEHAQIEQDDLESSSENNLSPANDTVLRKIMGGRSGAAE
jgi:hypothetical protein